MLDLEELEYLPARTFTSGQECRLGNLPRHWFLSDVEVVLGDRKQINQALAEAVERVDIRLSDRIARVVDVEDANLDRRTRHESHGCRWRFVIAIARFNDAEVVIHSRFESKRARVRPIRPQPKHERLTHRRKVGSGADRDGHDIGLDCTEQLPIAVAAKHRVYARRGARIGVGANNRVCLLARNE